jgi:hypothetical protein
MYAEVKTNYNEPRYTLEQAKQIIYQERKEQRLETVYSIKQKLLGIALVVSAITVPMFLPEFANISIFLIVVGIGLMLTKEKAIG